MTWNDHVSYTVKRVSGVLWQLTRLKQAGGTREKLIKFYILKIRSILMFGAVCFHSSLNLEQRHRLEMQQKRSLIIILGSDYNSYNQAKNITGLQDLESLREETCLKWAQKSQAHPKHSHLFPKNSGQVQTRWKQEFRVPRCKTARYFNSAIPHMIRLLNRFGTNHNKKK